MERDEQLISYLRQRFPVYSLPIEVDDARDMVDALEGEGLVKCFAALRSCGDGCESWTQLEYWSDKLKRRVIWNEEYQPDFWSLGEFVADVVATDEAVAAFEARLPDIANERSDGEEPVAITS